MTLRKLEEWSHLCVSPAASVLEVARILQDTSTRIVLVVGEETKLLGIVTDGDIRRGMLAGIFLNEPCARVMNSQPRTVTPESRIHDALQLVADNSVEAVPTVTAAGELRGVWVGVSGREKLSNTVVIMAGGQGMRMRPLTSSTPKPLVSVRNKPLLHHLLESIRSEGFDYVTISINHLGEKIEESVADGSRWGLSVTYLREESPLGTAGALGLLETVTDIPIVVINADVLTHARLRGVVDNHIEVGADFTVGMRVHDIEHPFGVLQLEESLVTGIIEKPLWREFVSAGVYVVSPEVLKLIPAGRYLDMPDLVTKAIGAGLRVEGFPLHEVWLDVGTPEDLRRAQDLVKGGPK